LKGAGVSWSPRIVSGRLRRVSLAHDWRTGVSPCEHTFVTSQGSAYARFRRYLDACQVDNALLAAHELPRISLSDALELCELLAREHDARFSRAAGRWVVRFAQEHEASLEEIQLAAGALAQLSADPGSQVALSALRALADGER
jgi:hypothetical protein